MSGAGASGDPLFSVVVPTCNRPAQLRECLTALTQQTLASSLYEVIVVDDGSTKPLTDVVASFAPRLDVRVLRQAHQGAAAARNKGIAAARGRVFAFTDDDCRPDPDWLAQLVTPFEQGQELLVGGQVTNALTDNVFAAASQLIHDLAYAHHNDNGAPCFFASNNLAVTAGSLVRLGGFDPEFRVASEDRDLCARWGESGGALMYCPQARVAHAHRLTLRRFWTQHFRYGRGAWRFHQTLRQRQRGRFAHDARFHARFLRRAAPLLPRHARAWSIAALLLVWQVANLSGFMFEALRNRLPSAGPSAKIS